MTHHRSSNIIAVLFLVLFFWPSHVFSAKESPIVPTIAVSPDVYYPFDEVLYLEGRADPGVAVEIQLTKSGAKPRKFSVRADQTGEWVLAEKMPLEAGDWEVRTRAMGAQNAVSDWSNPRVFKVIVSGITIGGVNIKFAFFAMVIVVLLLLGGVAFLYFGARIRSLKAALRNKEIREAKESIREGLSELRQDLLDELRMLETGNTALNQAALQRKEHILRELDLLERNMTREISDIEN